MPRTNALMAEAAAKTGRDVGNYVLFMVIADETDEAAEAKWKHYNDGADLDGAGLAGRPGQRRRQCGGDAARRGQMAAPTGAVNFNMGTLVGSYASVARMLDEVRRRCPATKGIMLTFDDFLIGMEQFGQRIQPLMKSRQRQAEGGRLEQSFLGLDQPMASP